MTNAVLITGNVITNTTAREPRALHGAPHLDIIIRGNIVRFSDDARDPIDAQAEPGGEESFE